MKAAVTASKLQAKEAAPVAEPISLPTKSWRALLQEQSFNADAKAFVPGQASLVQKKNDKSTEATNPTSLSPPKDTDPQWLQYLSQKFETNAPDAPNKFQPSGFNRARLSRGKGKGKGAPTGMPVDTVDAFGGSLAGGGGLIHTEAYLKLLKDGATKKRVPMNSQTARRTQNNNSDDSTELPMTMSSLAKTWSSAVQNSGLTSDTTKDVVERTTRDDILIEKLLYDQDISDPAYYSDTDLAVISHRLQTGNKSNPSMHRVGRRPSLVTSAIRTYVMQDLSFELDQTVGMLLLRLQRFMDQQRMFVLSDTTSEQRLKELQQRRFVIGLKEVSRRTKHGKVECLIVAPDIEQDANSGGLDDRMRELLAQAYQNDTPVIFALSRARLGKALGKSLNISVLGILDSTGTQGLAESKRLASEGRQAWLARLAK